MSSHTAPGHSGQPEQPVPFAAAAPLGAPGPAPSAGDNRVADGADPSRSPGPGETGGLPGPGEPGSFTESMALPRFDGRFAAILALGLAIMLFGHAVWRAPSVMADWHAYYRAGLNLTLGRDIYAEGKELVSRNSYDFWNESDGHYIYPPLLAMAIAPITPWLNIGKAGDLWLLVLSMAVLISLAVILLLLRAPPSLALLTALCVPILASTPVLLGIRYGQADLLLVALLLLALLADRRGAALVGGLLLGLAASVKPTLALYGLYYLRKRRWWTLAGAVVAGSIVGLGPFLLLGWSALVDWLTIAGYFGGGEIAHYPSNQSPRGWLLRLFDGGPRHQPLLEARWLADLLWTVFVAVAVAIWWRCLGPASAGRSNPAGGAGASRVPEGAAGDRRALLEFALTVVLVLAISPLSEDIHYVALIAPLGVLAVTVAGGGGPGRLWRWLATLACFYFLQPWLEFAYNLGGEGRLGLLYSGSWLYGLALVGLALLWLVWARPAGHPRRGD